MHLAGREPRLRDAPAVQLPDGSLSRGHGLDQHQRGQHHRHAAAEAAQHDRAGRVLPWAPAIPGTWPARPTANAVCVSLAGTHELSVIERSALLSEPAHRTMSPMMGVWPIYPSLGASLWQRIRLPGKGPRGLAVAGSQVYVAEYFSDTVAVVDLPTPTKRKPVTHRPGPAAASDPAAARAAAVPRRDGLLPAVAELRQLPSGRPRGRL